MKKIFNTAMLSALLAMGHNVSAQTSVDIQKAYEHMQNAIEADLLASSAVPMHKFLKEFVKFAHHSPEDAIEFAQSNLRDNGGAFYVNTSNDKLVTIISFYNFDSFLTPMYEHIFLSHVDGNWHIIDETSLTERMEKSLPKLIYGLHQVTDSNGGHVYIVFEDESEGTSMKHKIYTMIIEKGKLIRNSRHFKSKIGMMGELSYSNEVKDTSTNLDAQFDPQTQAIIIPVVKFNGRPPDKYTIYKFKGQYFEKMK